MQQFRAKESYRLDSESLKYDFLSINRQSNLRIQVKGAGMPYMKKLFTSLETPLRTNLKDGEQVFGKTSFSDRMITD
jgi:hypothetical protein